MARAASHPTKVPNPASAKSPHRPAACPYCALLCDDLTLRARADHSFTITRNGCSRAALDFARPPPANKPLVGGKPASLDAAIEAAAGLLRRATEPLFAGLATDVDGIRALVNLAERHHATLDHVHGEAMNAMSHVLQTRGWYATTLSEIRNRADIVVVVDADLNTRHENFARRCLRPRARLGADKTRSKNAPKVIYIGRRKHLAAELRADDTVFCQPARLPEVLRGLLAAVRGQPLHAKRVGGVQHAALTAIAATLNDAAYTALVFSPATLTGQRENTIATLCDTVDQLNITSRAAILPLGGDDGGQSALATCSWLTGYPLRVRLGREPHYAPDLHRTERLLATGVSDCVLWVDAFGRHPLPPTATLENCIVLGSNRTRRVAEAAVFIPVGTPGVDHFARLARTDAVVTVALDAQRDSELPSVADVATRLMVEG